MSTLDDIRARRATASVVGHTYADTRPRVYLAGPILGCTQGEATDWRKFVAARS
jgi:hypothetical protein